MSYPGNPRFRTLMVVASVLAIAVLAVAAQGQVGTTPATPTQTMGTGMVGTGAASSITQDAWLIRDNVASSNVERVNGTIAVRARSASDVRATTSGDTLEYGIARIRIPSENVTYEVRFTDLDRTSAGSHYGGVGLLREMFGNTGIGESQLPRAFAYLAVFGMADVTRGGQTIATGVPAHIVVTQGIHNPGTGMLLSQANPDTREIMLHVPGPVTGLPDGFLLVSWPDAALNLSDVGGRVMTATGVTTAVLPGEPARPGQVLGEAVPVPQQVINVTLTNQGFAQLTRPALVPGLITFNVTNNSSINRGLIIRGQDIIGSPVQRGTQLLRPGQSTTFQVYLPTGNFTLTEMHQISSAGQTYWRSAYSTTMMVGGAQF